LDTGVFGECTHAAGEQEYYLCGRRASAGRTRGAGRVPGGGLEFAGDARGTAEVALERLRLGEREACEPGVEGGERGRRARAGAALEARGAAAEADGLAEERAVGVVDGVGGLLVEGA
jgi:hypothetical protein